jgi:hypothetical protein
MPSWLEPSVSRCFLVTTSSSISLLLAYAPDVTHTEFCACTALKREIGSGSNKLLISSLHSHDRFGSGKASQSSVCLKRPAGSRSSSFSELSSRAMKKPPALQACQQPVRVTSTHSGANTPMRARLLWRHGGTSVAIMERRRSPRAHMSAAAGSWLCTHCSTDAQRGDIAPSLRIQRGTAPGP